MLPYKTSFKSGEEVVKAVKKYNTSLCKATFLNWCMQSTSNEYVTEMKVFKTPFGNLDIVNLIQDVM